MNDKPNVMIALNEVKIHLSAELKGFPFSMSAVKRVKIGDTDAITVL